MQRRPACGAVSTRVYPLLVRRSLSNVFKVRAGVLLGAHVAVEMKWGRRAGVSVSQTLSLQNAVTNTTVAASLRKQHGEAGGARRSNLRSHYLS